MSDNPLQHDLDDELLSAYLDEELADEERALVEGRLAADPAARHKLDELRHVSQAVRGLPQEAVGRDLRESILRQANQAKRATETTSPKSHDDAPGRQPTFTIGRTRRGWLWATLAVAAALLIMFVQRDALDHENRPSVAQRRREPPSLTAAPESERLDRSLPAARQLADAETAAPPGAAGEASSADRSEPAEGLAALSRREPAGDMNGEQLVVVHVLAKREALENKTFDRLLASNGVAVESGAPEDEAAGSPERNRAISSRVAEQSPTSQPADEEADLDVVLVEAPSTTIMSCLADLNQDYANYLSVSVEDSAPAEDAPALQAAPAPEGFPTKKLAVDLGKYNRGFVSQQQKDLFARDKRYYQQSPNAGRYGVAIGGELDATSGLKQEEKQWLATDNYSNQGRAQRVQVSKSKTRLGAELRELPQQLKAPAQSNSDNLQVLFVLTPGDEPAASPAAENRAE